MIKLPEPKVLRREPAEMTRAALVQAALKLFGRQGFDGTSTREIAAEARANIGSIAYHFGGKEGLRTAAADFIVETIQTVAGPALGNAQAPAPVGPKAAQAQLFAALERMVGFVVASPQAGEIVQFILRELSHPTAALDRIYDGVFEPSHRRLCQLWEQATGEPAESEATRLTVFTLIGQVIYFRIGREAVMRRMGWPDIGAAEAAKVVAVTSGNLKAILAARKGAKTKGQRP
ncbi:CerR family C-terminal domain-containing protein [Mesorhizobium sp. XAP10]|uniref:CerR family C-terminal domain-containing protein n=1 Tax=unclassified Mesorhizobium TaxID=325217 RepID=UPI0023E03C08|nr:MULTISPECIES: CerR family C-terminal domain-containing protein [unclassified Mesorhizobium]MDF3152569.1 CerR family C-terminal domain-containing protein [Mesorhizobium sp. XAP10]MDF3245421.1 CerR family C-terminal domain-containing protein [Mesorhizobium sp. XAP4]